MTKGDKVLIGIVVILTFVSLGFMKRQAFSDESKFVSIQVNGQQVKKIIFDKKIIGKTYAIESEYGYNLVEIGDEEVRVTEASCRDKIDVKQGYISKMGESIICLPNRMVIEIKGEAKEEEMDIMNH